MNRRENTFRIDYSKVPKKPTYEEVHLFIGNQLGMAREEVKRIQCSRTHGCAFVKASDLAVAQRVVNEHDGKHEIVVDNKSYVVRMWMEDGGVDVKLYDLSEDVTDQVIADFLSDYGDVLSVREVMWDAKYMFGNIGTGVRVARMVVKRNIPSDVIIDGEPTAVAYTGQQQTCRHCNEFIHIGITCIQNKKLLLQKLAADQTNSSYANIVKQPPAPKANNPKQLKPGSSTFSGQRTKASKNRMPNKAITPTLTEQPNAEMPSSAASTAVSQTVQLENCDNAHFKIPQQVFRPEISSAQAKAGENLRNDGNETDESTSSNTSRRSRRPQVKKPRHDSDVVTDENPQL